MRNLMMMESDIDSLYEQHKQPNIHMYCFIHLDISDSVHKVSIKSISFENLDVLRSKLLIFFDPNNTDLLIDIFIKEGYDKDTECKYVLFAVSNNRYIEYCTWVKDNM